MPETVVVEYTGQRQNLMRVKVWVGGQIYNARGYVFGGSQRTQRMSRAEAEVLTGDTPPVVIPDTEEIVTGWAPVGHIPDEMMATETFALMEEA